MKKHLKKGNIRVDEIEDKLNRPNVKLANKFSLDNEDDVYFVLLLIFAFVFFGFAYYGLLQVIEQLRK